MSLVEQYRKNGYVVVPNACYEATTTELGGDDWWRDQLRAAYRESVDAYLNRVRLIAKDAWVHRLFYRSFLMNMAGHLGVRRPIIQTNPAVHVVCEELRIPGGYFGVGAHQDWPALQSGLNTVVAWIPFFDVTLDDYPVEVVPGSHLLGLLPAKPGEHISAVDDTGMEFTPVPMKRGDVLLFSAFTVHRTRVQGNGFRIAVSHRYEDSQDPWFLAHGQFSAQRRVIERDIRSAPSADEVRAVFQ